MEEPKAPREARRREAPDSWEVGSGEGRRSPSPVWGSVGIVPRKFWNLTVQICSFFSTISRHMQMALPSVVFHSFTAYICILFIIELLIISVRNLHWILLLHITHSSQLHTWQSQLHTLCQKTQFYALKSVKICQQYWQKFAAAFFYGLNDENDVYFLQDLSLFVNEVKRDNETLMAIRSLQKR